MPPCQEPDLVQVWVAGEEHEPVEAVNPVLSAIVCTSCRPRRLRIVAKVAGENELSVSVFTPGTVKPSDAERCRACGE